MTLNQLKYKLIDFFKTHAQINSVVYADDYDYNAEAELSYPCVNMGWNQSVPTLSAKTLNHFFTIQIADRVDDNVIGMEDEIFSDSIQIGQDFIAWLMVQEEFVLKRTSAMSKFSDDTKDRVSGIRFEIDLAVPIKLNECEKPVI